MAPDIASLPRNVRLVDSIPPVKEQSGFLRSITLGYQLGSVFLTAHEEGILSALLIPGTLEDICLPSRMDPDRLRLLLGMLVSGGILTHHNGRYQVRSDLVPFLDRTSPLYARWLDCEVLQRHQWADLVRYLRKENPPGLDSSHSAYSPHLTIAEIRRMGSQALLGRLQGIVEILNRDPVFSSAKRLLDLGGGHGLIGIACAEMNPDLQVIIYDRPEVVPVAWEHVCSRGVESQVICIGGDYIKGCIGGGYDVILQICPPDLDPETDSRVIRTIGAALNEGGLYARCGFFLDDFFTGPLITTSFAIAAEMRGEQRHLTIPELEGYIRSAGMDSDRIIDLTPVCDLAMYLVLSRRRKNRSSDQTRCSLPCRTGIHPCGTQFTVPDHP